MVNGRENVTTFQMLPLETNPSNLRPLIPHLADTVTAESLLRNPYSSLFSMFSSQRRNMERCPLNVPCLGFSAVFHTSFSKYLEFSITASIIYLAIVSERRPPYPLSGMMALDYSLAV
jgi:hypothetical protein